MKYSPIIFQVTKQESIVTRWVSLPAVLVSFPDFPFAPLLTSTASSQATSSVTIELMANTLHSVGTWSSFERSGADSSIRAANVAALDDEASSRLPPPSAAECRKNASPHAMHSEIPDAGKARGAIVVIRRSLRRIRAVLSHTAHPGESQTPSFVGSDE